MPSSALSNSAETITNVVFGITATTISIVTIWQGHKAWKVWHEHTHNQENVAPDVELGLQSFRSAATSLEAPEREEDMNSSAPSANQIGEVADSGPMSVSVSVQHLELQPTLPTPVDAETSLSPTSVREARIDSNGFPRVPTENTQPALTDMEGRELCPAANDHL